MLQIYGHKEGKGVPKDDVPVEVTFEPASGGPPACLQTYIHTYIRIYRWGYLALGGLPTPRLMGSHAAPRKFPLANASSRLHAAWLVSV